MAEELNRLKRIKSLLQDTKLIDSHTISAVVAECDAVIFAQRSAVQQDMAVHVCQIKDAVCGDRSDLWCDKCPKTIAALQRALTQRPAAQTEREAPAADPRIRIDFKQATELLEMFNGLPAEIVLQTGDGHSGRGLYAWWDADPSAGAMYLGETDEEAAPEAPTARQQSTPTREAREAEQRARMQARLATRHEGKATADFDLPAPNDAAQQAHQEAARGVSAIVFPEVQYIDGCMHSTTTFKDNGKPIMLDAYGNRSVFCDLNDDDDPVQQATPETVGEPRCTTCGVTMNEPHHPACGAVTAAIIGLSTMAAQDKEARRRELAAKIRETLRGVFNRPAPAVPGANVSVPLQVLKDASEAIGHFVSDHGWGNSDMQAMDNLDAYIAQHAAQAKGGEA